MYALASNLVGFASSQLRVLVTRQEGAYTWVITADLLDAGTRLVLDSSQVAPEPETTEVASFPGGLVQFEDPSSGRAFGRQTAGVDFEIPMGGFPCAVCRDQYGDGACDRGAAPASAHVINVARRAQVDYLDRIEKRAKKDGWTVRSFDLFLSGIWSPATGPRPAAVADAIAALRTIAAKIGFDRASTLSIADALDAEEIERGRGREELRRAISAGFTALSVRKGEWQDPARVALDDLRARSAANAALPPARFAAVAPSPETCVICRRHGWTSTCIVRGEKSGRICSRCRDLVDVAQRFGA